MHSTNMAGVLLYLMVVFDAVKLNFDGPSVKDATPLRRGSTNVVAVHCGSAEHAHCKEGHFRAKQPKQTTFHQHTE